MCNQNTSEYQYSGAVTNVQNMKHKLTEFNIAISNIKIFNITYSHIKDTTGIRYGMNVHLVILTGAGNMRPVGEAAFLGQTLTPSH